MITISEKEACSLFIDLTFRTIKRFWHEGMANDLEKTLHLETNLKDNEIASFEFTMAFLALQMNTLFYILEKNRAERMRNFVLECLRTKMNNDTYAVDLIEKYETVISKYPKFDYPAKYYVPHLDNLTEAIGIVLADAFGAKTTVEIEGKAAYNIFEIAVLGSSFLLFSVSWNWKKFLESVELTETT